jgi:hypothetical protein
MSGIRTKMRDENSVWEEVPGAGGLMPCNQW